MNKKRQTDYCRRSGFVLRKRNIHYYKSQQLVPKRNIRTISLFLINFKMPSHGQKSNNRAMLTTFNKVTMEH